MRIHAIQTGTVEIKRNQVAGKGAGPLRQLNVLLGSEWTAPLPVLAWVIEHAEGLLVVDTGETALTANRGYFPRWHPYYRSSVRLVVTPDEEIGPQLQRLGFSPADVKTVVLTHLHTDHTGGLRHFPDAEVLVHAAELSAATGILARFNGYLPHRWPAGFAPRTIVFENEAVGPFESVHYLTRARDVMIVPTLGHTPGHVSVIARRDGISFFLAGDTTYSEQLLLERRVDGITRKTRVSLRTVDRILEYASSEPTVYLPSHDAMSVHRLDNAIIVPPITLREGGTAQPTTASEIAQAQPTPSSQGVGG